MRQPPNCLASPSTSALRSRASSRPCGQPERDDRRGARLSACWHRCGARSLIGGDLASARGNGEGLGRRPTLLQGGTALPCRLVGPKRSAPARCSKGAAPAQLAVEGEVRQGEVSRAVGELPRARRAQMCFGFSSGMGPAIRLRFPGIRVLVCKVATSGVIGSWVREIVRRNPLLPIAHPPMSALCITSRHLRRQVRTAALDPLQASRNDG